MRAARALGYCLLVAGRPFGQMTTFRRHPAIRQTRSPLAATIAAWWFCDAAVPASRKSRPSGSSAISPPRAAAATPGPSTTALATARRSACRPTSRSTATVSGSALPLLLMLRTARVRAGEAYNLLNLISACVWRRSRRKEPRRQAPGFCRSVSPLEQIRPRAGTRSELARSPILTSSPRRGTRCLGRGAGGLWHDTGVCHPCLTSTEPRPREILACSRPPLSVFSLG